MMNLVERFWDELVEETAFITEHLRFAWNSMSYNEQLYGLMMMCATCLLLGLRNPQRTSGFKLFDFSEEVGHFKTFMFAAAVLMMFTFAVNVAVDAVS